VGRGRWDIVQSHERTLGQDVYRAGEGCHRGYLASAGHPRSRRVYHAITLALERRVFARTPCVVAIAARGREEIRTYYRVPDARLRVVYNGVDLARFHPRQRERHRGAVLQEVGIAPGAFVILFVGSGFERKGLATAIEALAAMADRTAWLLVIGKGNREPFEALAARLGVTGRVRLLGARPDAERWYGAADAVVLPTRYEPFGNVHLEALASGVPVVTSIRAGGAELIEDGVNGYAVHPLDSGAVGRALEKVRAMAGPQVAEAARRSAEPFTHAAQAEAFVAIYREMRSARPLNP
jgi:UDP-glucose:(heptosyl)LPS alpha-1,3-glucosyltransferase